MSAVKIAFVDFWTGFNTEDNFIRRALDGGVELSDKPQVVFYSCFGRRHREHPQSLKVFFTGENVRPNWTECHYAMSFDLDEKGGRNFRWPLYNFCGNLHYEPTAGERNKFCCIVVSNAKSRLRLDFSQALSKYRQVDSGGRAMNNIGGPVADKAAFIKDYKFNIVFENSYFPGYTTEKLVDAKQSGCVPIYWGNPEVELDFNGESFVNCHRFRSFSQCIDYIESLDKDPVAFERMQCQPLLKDNTYTRYSDPAALAQWLEMVVHQRAVPKMWWQFLSYPVAKLQLAKTLLNDAVGTGKFKNDAKLIERQL